MNKKCFVISEIIIGVVAVIVILLGTFYTSIVGLFTKADDPNVLNDADIGKTFTFECMDNFIDADENSFVLCYFDEDGEGYCYYVRTPSDLYKKFEARCMNVVGTYEGVFKEADEDTRNTVISKLDEFYFMLSDNMDDFDYSEEYQNAVHESVSNYYIEVVSINDTASVVPQYIAYVAGVVLLFVLFIRLIAFLRKTSTRKIATIIVGAVLVIVIVIVAITFDKVRTIASVKNEGDGIYSMTFYGDLKVDNLLESDISTTEELINWIIREQVYGLPLSVDEENFRCATFVCGNPDGDTLMGRNFDYSETDTVVIYTNPENGYASYSLADLTVLGIGEYGIQPESLMGRAYMMAAPYMCLDGMNEAGLAVGILELDIGETHQDDDKSDLLIYSAVRALLDKCANVDEAIDLLDNYDIHTSIGVTYHLQIADKSGRAVVVEWLDGQMYVNELSAATNSVLTPGEYFDEGDPDRRIVTIIDTLERNNYVLAEDEARDLLDMVSHHTYTEWSCIYNLDRFKVDVYIDTDYSKAYSFGGD